MNLPRPSEERLGNTSLDRYPVRVSEETQMLLRNGKQNGKPMSVKVSDIHIYKLAILFAYREEATR